MKVIFLPKPGKDDYSSAKSFRPITLSNYILKGLERIVQWKVEEIIPRLHSQHAYTKGLSTETALSQAVDLIEKSIYQKQCTLAVSFDCTGAFDCIQFHSANTAMTKLGIPQCIASWYMELLNTRTVTAELKGEKFSVQPTRGSPQGGVLSPVVWNMIMDTLLTEFKEDAVQVIGYADDILLLISGKHPSTLVNRMQDAINIVLKWGATNGLTFNPSKSRAIVFSKAYKLRSKYFPQLYIAGMGMEYEAQMKYLGVIFDQGLTWTEHLKAKAAKCSRIWNMAKAVIGQKWGLTSDKILWLYEAMIRPIITYGCLIWGHSITAKKDGIRKLKSIQRKVLLGMTQTLRSTPTSGLEAVLGITPLDLYIKEHATKSRWRTKFTLRDTWDGVGNLPRRRGHRFLSDKILDKLKLNQVNDYITSCRIWVDNCNVEHPDTIIYTDGSKDEQGCTGAGWTITRGDVSIHQSSVSLNNEASVFQAEVTAITPSVIALLNQDKPSKNVIIRSDSQSAIAAILNPLTKSETVKKCKETLNIGKCDINIKLDWCKGHSNITGNEYAYYLAKKGIESESRLSVGAPPSYIKKVIHEFFFYEWCSRYKDDQLMKHTHR
ncbi:Uncharacterized protein FKW44_018195, partial [Caligus rogercresseyi]